MALVIAGCGLVLYPSQQGVPSDPNGPVYFGKLHLFELENNRVRQIRENDGTLQTLAGGVGPSSPSSVAFQFPKVVSDVNGHLFITDACYVRVLPKFDTSLFGQNLRARELALIAGNGSCTEVDNDDVLATQASVPQSRLAIDGSGNLYLNTTNSVQVIAANDGNLFGRSVTRGYLYTIAGSATDAAYAGDGGPMSTRDSTASPGSLSIRRATSSSAMPSTDAFA